MTAAEDYEPNSIDGIIPLRRSNSFVPSERHMLEECCLIEPSADVRKMPNTQLAGQVSQSIATG